MIWIGLAIGFLIGGFFGVSAMCLVTAGKQADIAMGIDDIEKSK
jgi:hypothetical protein